MLIDPDGHEADDVFIDPHLAFHLGHRCAWRIDVHEREMGLAVLFDAVGQGLYTPIFGLSDRSAVL